jgi:hypothetical protein
MSFPALTLTTPPRPSGHPRPVAVVAVRMHARLPAGEATGEDREQFSVTSL